MYQLNALEVLASPMVHVASRAMHTTMLDASRAAAGSVMQSIYKMYISLLHFTSILLLVQVACHALHDALLVGNRAAAKAAMQRRWNVCFQNLC